MTDEKGAPWPWCSICRENEARWRVLSEFGVAGMSACDAHLSEAIQQMVNERRRSVQVKWI